MAKYPHLKLRRMGDKVLGVQLKGNPKQPEPQHFRVVFPGGDVDIARCSDGSHWIHVRVNHPDNPNDAVRDQLEGTGLGHLVDGRVDLLDRHASESSCGDLNHPQAYHMAVRISPISQEEAG